MFLEYFRKITRRTRVVWHCCLLLTSQDREASVAAGWNFSKRHLAKHKQYFRHPSRGRGNLIGGAAVLRWVGARCAVCLQEQIMSMGAGTAESFLCASLVAGWTASKQSSEYAVGLCSKNLIQLNRRLPQELKEHKRKKLI